MVFTWQLYDVNYFFWGDAHLRMLKTNNSTIV